jgi:hypothetical protein
MPRIAPRGTPLSKAGARSARAGKPATVPSRWEWCSVCQKYVPPEIPNAETRAAMRECERGNLRSARTIEEFVAELNADD